MRVGGRAGFRLVSWAFAACVLGSASQKALADPPPPPPAPGQPGAPPTFPTPQPCPGPKPATPAPAPPVPTPPAPGTPPPANPPAGTCPKVVRSTNPPVQEEMRLRRADGTEIYFYRTNFVTPGELIQAVTSLVNIPDLLLKDIPRSNQVAMQGPSEAIDTGLEVFAYFDVADPQVFVEAKIVELTYDSNFEFGFSSILDRNVDGPNTIWRGYNVNLSPPTFLQSQLPGASPFQGAGLAFGFVGKLAEEFGAMDLKLEALQRDGTAEVLSRPSI